MIVCLTCDVNSSRARTLHLHGDFVPFDKTHLKWFPCSMLTNKFKFFAITDNRRFWQILERRTFRVCQLSVTLLHNIHMVCNDNDDKK